MRTARDPKVRHSREGGNLSFLSGAAIYETWIPAFAGKTKFFGGWLIAFVLAWTVMVLPLTSYCTIAPGLYAYPERRVEAYAGVAEGFAVTNHSQWHIVDSRAAPLAVRARNRSHDAFPALLLGAAPVLIIVHATSPNVVSLFEAVARFMRQP